MNTLSKLQTYMGGRKILLPGALALSAMSSLLGMLPFIFIWLIVRELFKSQAESSQGLIDTYSWWAMGTAVGGVFVYFLALMLSHLAAFRAETNMRRQAMQKIVKLPLGFFDGNTSGSIRKIVDDNASVTHMFLAHQMPDLAGSILTPMASLVLIFVFDWRLALACLIPIIAAMMIMRFMMGKRGRHFMKTYMDALEDMNTEAVEYVRGIPVVKVFQQTVFSFKNFHNSITKYKDMVSQYTIMWEKPMSAYTVIIHGFVYILVPVAILLIGNSGNYAGVLLDLFFFILITPVFAQSIMKNMYMNQAVGQAAEAVNRLEDLTSVEPLAAAPNPISITGHEISFKEVSFRYPGSEQKAIDNISFTIPEGKTYALVGASGSGKTTIARLIPRFWDADTGRITVGGTDVKDIAPKELMQHVSFVFQNTRLFKTTLLENIRYGNPHATDKAIEHAVNLAQCREIINRLPEGLNTKIGTEGTYLSGGEQQRIALARAILKDAPIVVLDEATAFSDPENEHLIQKALGKLTKGKTVLTIAHRLTSVMDMDSILVIDKGKIAEQGTHHELINRQGLYAKMWNEYQKSIQWTIGKNGQYA
jgi:ATP-binding cassette, subfamily B, bacterial IrtA/YbtP